jgi:hypothetical protein
VAGGQEKGRIVTGINKKPELVDRTELKRQIGKRGELLVQYKLFRVWH